LTFGNGVEWTAHRQQPTTKPNQPQRIVRKNL